jgi:hypothetical protein
VSLSGDFVGKPLAGILVSGTRKGRPYKTVTDSTGCLDFVGNGARGVYLLTKISRAMVASMANSEKPTRKI